MIVPIRAANKLLVNDHAVMFWRYEDPVGSAPTGEELGRLVYHLWKVPVADVDLPRWDPVRAPAPDAVATRRRHARPLAPLHLVMLHSGL